MSNANLHAKIQYDRTAPLYTEDVFYAFQPEKRLAPLREAISNAIDEMKTDGSLKEILKGLQPSKEKLTAK